MPSLSSKDRVSLCCFTFDDGRRCRTPRISTNPHFCFYHAQKEAQARATENIADDLAYFFSGDYLSANDLNTALSRVFVAVARGDLKPRAARTLAYLAQTMFQTLHLAQYEFITACGEKDWRHTVVKSINANHAYRFPNRTEPAAPQTPTPAPSQPPTAPQTQPQPIPAQRSAQVQTAAPQAQILKPLPAQPAPPAAVPRVAPSEPAPAASTTSFPVEAGLPRPELQPTAEPTPPATQTPPPPAPPRSAIQTPDHYAVHYGPEYRLTVDGKPW